MSTALLTDERLNIRYFKAADEADKAAPVMKWSLENANGTASFSDFAVFRVGTFKDSMGIQHTWEPEHLTQMVFNYELLRDRGIIPHVPIRRDHSLSIDNVVGYVTSLTFTNGILYAAGDITEPDAKEKIDRGTFRNRSSEIGIYETNDEAFYWPVFFGFAFVDYGAVEGLFTTPHRNAHQFSLITDKEYTLPTPTDTKHTFQVGGQPTSDYSAVQAHITSLETQVAAIVPPAKFKLNGAETSDYSAVQAHVDILETALSDIDKNSREAFVKQLATDKKIGAPQIDAMTAHATSLTPEQFTAFKAMYEAAPTVPALGTHAGGNTNPDNEADKGGAPTEAETLEEIVATHRRGGMTEEAIEKTASFKRLAVLRAAK